MLLPLPAHAQPAADKLALCTACHGANGVPVDPSIPVIAGQQEGYLYLELRDFKLGNRRSEVMRQVAEGLDKANMLALAAYFAARPWPDLGQKPAAAAQAHRAELLAGSAVCQSCHGAGFRGASVTPRTAGQSETYLRATMLAFRSGARANNPGMTGVLKNYTDTDIAALAAFLAGI
ncbi:MAG: c-type cytochrome [Acetobacteraceae bacterium]